MCTFGVFGGASLWRVITWPLTCMRCRKGRDSPYAFVLMKRAESVQKAIDALHGGLLMEHVIIVQPARPPSTKCFQCGKEGHFRKYVFTYICYIIFGFTNAHSSECPSTVVAPSPSPTRGSYNYQRSLSPLRRRSRSPSPYRPNQTFEEDLYYRGRYSPPPFQGRRRSDSRYDAPRATPMTFGGYISRPIRWDFER